MLQLAPFLATKYFTMNVRELREAVQALSEGHITEQEFDERREAILLRETKTTFPSAKLKALQKCLEEHLLGQKEYDEAKVRLFENHSSNDVNADLHRALAMFCLRRLTEFYEDGLMDEEEFNFRKRQLVPSEQQYFLKDIDLKRPDSWPSVQSMFMTDFGAPDGAFVITRGWSYERKSEITLRIQNAVKFIWDPPSTSTTSSAYALGNGIYHVMAVGADGKVIHSERCVIDAPRYHECGASAQVQKQQDMAPCCFALGDWVEDSSGRRFQVVRCWGDMVVVHGSEETATNEFFKGSTSFTAFHKTLCNEMFSSSYAPTTWNAGSIKVDSRLMLLLKSCDLKPVVWQVNDFPLLKLPLPALSRVMASLPWSSAAAASLTCKALLVAFRDERVWKERTLREDPAAQLCNNESWFRACERVTFFKIRIVTVFYHRGGRTISGDFTVRVSPKVTVVQFLKLINNPVFNKQARNGVGATSFSPHDPSKLYSYKSDGKTQPFPDGVPNCKWEVQGKDLNTLTIQEAGLSEGACLEQAEMTMFD